MNTQQSQPQTVAFLKPEGFSDPVSYAEQVRTSAQVIFVQRPDADSDGACCYVISNEGGRCYLPNSCKLFLNDVSIQTVTYENQMYGTQEKLLVGFTTVGGDSYVYRMGLMSYGASSLLVALVSMNSVSITGEIEITWVAKGAAVFSRVATAVDGGYVSVAIPQSSLGKKLTFDELQDAITYVNQSINTGDAVPPRFFEPDAENASIAMPAVNKRPARPTTAVHTPAPATA